MNTVRAPLVAGISTGIHDIKYGSLEWFETDLAMLECNRAQYIEQLTTANQEYCKARKAVDLPDLSDEENNECKALVRVNEHLIRELRCSYLPGVNRAIAACKQDIAAERAKRAQSTASKL